ncbi:RIPOR family member 3-like isoform X2 [Leucoraja erinacea]|uniref:RIPOR family member 3-like isoform X2 n=1 Tax=Leucoraja erinaceus TaxID=7782 RepID=UPI00245751BC|nr:RIPOR family member 3-like isoform X2 [Leucoraja erinacea]
MSVKLHFASPADSSGLNRSRSFTGFSSVPSRRSQGSFVSRSSPMSRVSSVKSTTRLVTSQKNSSSLEPRPIRVEKICKSLRKGLNNYIESRQNELDLLTMQQKDMKRNSRLAFLYDLDKQIRTTERYVRKLEFHISRIEELYESYFIQWRLRNGANNMRRAYSITPSTKGSRETLLEINRNYRLCTEDMCVIEKTLEILLGEFHIRMKGLIGFARLCPGDHYEVLIRYGRQRWKLKGKIDADDRQTWDEEEMVFLPHLNEDIEIKVAEMKGLMTVLVGTVTCESADFFTAQPQIMIVDITDLGTIKLQLEVTWNPFDADETSVTSGSVSKFSWPSRKGSVYNWTPPSTPSFKDKYFSHIRQEDKLPSLYQETKGTFIFNHSGNCFHNTHLSSVPENEKFYNYANLDKQGGNDNGYGVIDFQEVSQSLQDSLSTERTVQPPHVEPKTPDQEEFQKDSPRARQLQSCSALAESVLHKGPQLRLRRPTGKPAGQESTGQAWSTDITDPLNSQTSSTISCTHRSSASICSENLKANFTSVDIGNILQEILIILRTDQRNYKEIQNLEQQILHLGDILKKEVTVSRSTSTVSLSVETVLESFNFLNADSIDNLSYTGSVRMKPERNGTYNKSNSFQYGVLTRSGDLGMKTAGNFALTSKNQCLDKILLTHLQVCKKLLQRFPSVDSVLVLQNCILEELSQQILVLDTLAPFCYEKSANIKSVEEVIPKSRKRKSVLSFWHKCTEGECILHLSAEQFLIQLRNCYVQKVAAKYPGQTERVFRTLLHQIISCCELLPCPNVSEESVTVFQFFNYIQKYNITQLGTHLTSLAKEVFLPEALHSTYKVKALKKLKEKLVSELQPLRQTLQSISVLQLDENPKVAQTAISFLRSASANNVFRTKALAYYTESLQEKDVQHQRAACVALKQLKAVESIEQIASLCHSQVAHVHNVARETLISFGEKGCLAYDAVDRLWKEGMKQNSTTQITIL